MSELAAQGGTEARYHNYLSIYKNLRFSTLPWYDLQVFSDDEEHLHQKALKLPLETGSDSNSDTESPVVAMCDDAIQVGHFSPPASLPSALATHSFIESAASSRQGTITILHLTLETACAGHSLHYHSIQGPECLIWSS